MGLYKRFVNQTRKPDIASKGSLIGKYAGFVRIRKTAENRQIA